MAKVRRQRQTNWSRFLVILWAFLCVQQAQAAITYVRSGGVTGTTTGASFSFDIGTAGTDRLVVLIADDESSVNNLTGATVDGKSCFTNQVAIANNIVGIGNHQEMYYCDEDDLGASSGLVTVTVTAAAGAGWGLHAHLYTGVDQNGPTDNQIDNTSAAQNEILPAAIDIPANGLLVFGAANGQTGTYNNADWDTSPTEGTDDGLSPEIEMTEVTDSPNPASAILATAYWISSTTAQTNRLFRARGSVANNRGTGIIAAWPEAVTGGSAAVTGAITPSVTELEIVPGGKTIIITLANDTWVPAGATFDAIRQDIIDGLDSGGSDLTGWNNEVRDKQGVSGVVRTSATVVTITLDGQAAYNNLSDETITVTVPAAAVNGGSLIGATPTFDVTASGGRGATPGDYLIRRNALDSSTLVPNTGSNLDALWDTPVDSKGSSITYSAGTFTLASGIYLVMYSEQFATLSTTNNERLGIHGQLVIGGSPVEEGHAHGYIRKNGGSQEAAVHGAAIVRIASDGTSLVTRFYRDDNTTGGGEEPNRVADTGGVIILVLDDTHAYARCIPSAKVGQIRTES